MKEIKFKAQNPDNVWLYGYYKHSRCDHYILTKDKYGFLEENPIIPETLREFTGLYDDEGSEIYEGDILRLYPISYDEDGTRTISLECQQDTIVFQNGGFKLENGPYLHEIERMMYRILVLSNEKSNDKVIKLCNNFDKNRNDNYPELIEVAFLEFAKKCVKLPLENYHCTYNIKSNELEVAFSYNDKNYKVTETINNNVNNKYTLYLLNDNIVLHLLSSNNIMDFNSKLEE